MTEGQSTAVPVMRRPGADRDEESPGTPGQRGGRGLGWLLRWELLLTGILALPIAVGWRSSPGFSTAQNFTNLTGSAMEVGIMALAMSLIIIAGEIDLSVESMVGVAGAVLGFLWAAGVPLWLGIPAVLVLGGAGGLLNGVL